MNERIDELLEQSRTEYWTQYTPSYDYEKFAELIVRECIDVVGRATASPNGYQALIKHFGVE
jgi:hypothetical protein